MSPISKFLLIHIWCIKFALNGKGAAGICPSPPVFSAPRGKSNLAVDAFSLLVTFERQEGII